MIGGADPENRGPMRWDLVHADNPELAWIKRLIEMRRQCRALRVGNFRLVESDCLLAFERCTEQALETVVVLVNPSGDALTERLLIANAGLMDVTPMVDLLQPVNHPPVTIMDSACITMMVPAETVMVLAPREQKLGGYSRYKRIS